MPVAPVLRRSAVTDSGSSWLTRAEPARVGIHLDGEGPLPVGGADTVTLGLLDHGHVETITSAKYRRARGPYCLTGDCGTCLVRIDGRPNQRACLTRVRDGMRIGTQNKLIRAAPDPTRLVDKFIGTMDHHHFLVRPRVVNQAMQAVARELTGFGSLPDHPPDGASAHEVSAPDVLVVGAGPAGRAAAQVLGGSQLDILWIDRGLDSPTAGGLRCRGQTGVFAAYRREGIWAAMTDDGTRPPTLHTIRPRHVLLCVGARPPTIPLPNNDLPGIVAARGLLRQLRRVDATLAAKCIVIGEGETAQRAATRLGARCIAPSRVTRLEGSTRVEEVVTTDGTLEVQLVAFAPTAAAAHDLPRQAGAKLRFDGTGFATVRDDDGRCVTEGPWQVWAAGEVAGVMSDAGAADDARRVAAALLTAAQEKR